MSEVTWSEVAAALASADREAMAAARWFAGKGRPIDRLDLVEAFDLGEGTALAIADLAPAAHGGGRYLLPLARPDGRLAVDDGPRALGWLAVAIAEGRTIAGLPRERPGFEQPGTAAPVSAALVCRPAAGLATVAPGRVGEVRGLATRLLGADQSNTSIVVGERLLLKAYRRLEDGLNPDLEMNAYLAEEARFAGVPPLAGYAEVVTKAGAATVALLQGFVADGLDAYEATAEGLTAWILAPGQVTVEFATEIAAGMGSMTAALHAALLAGGGVPGFEVREAGRDELRTWRRDAQRQLARALEVVGGAAGEELRAVAPLIGEELSVLEAVATVPVVGRIHGDLHLGQVLLTPEGPRIVDFEGDPMRPIGERRRPASPLRDVASMLRSLDHVGRSARRRAERRRGGPVEAPGLDVDAWLARARERFVEAYRRDLHEAGAPVAVDRDLLRAFEIAKECAEFVYAVTWLPDWLWAPQEGMRNLLAEARRPA